MKVALLSKADARGGGASRVAQDLASGLLREGHEVTHFRASPRERDSVTARSLHGSGSAHLRPFLSEFQRWLGLPDLVPVEFPAIVRANLPRAFDVVHVHDTTTAISPFTLRRLARRLPLLWTFHDCSPFTAGCLYPDDCTLFRTRCGPCPGREFWPMDGRFDATALLHRAREKVLTDGNVMALSPSEWMADLAFSSGRLAVRPRVVHNGIDAGVFKPPGDRTRIRKERGIPPDRPVVLVAAGSFRNSRKGIHEAVACLGDLRDLQPVVVVVGDADEAALRERLGGLEIRFAGFVSDQSELAGWYGTADLFLYTALVDNFPLVVLETMACGVPTVGFATGGVPEVVQDGRNGLLVPVRDVEGLARAARTAISGELLPVFSAAARARIVETFGFQTCLRDHVAIYEEAVRGWESRRAR